MNSSNDMDDPAVAVSLLQYLPGCGAGIYHQLRQYLGGLEALFSHSLADLYQWLPKTAHAELSDLYKNRWSSRAAQQYRNDQAQLTSLKATQLFHFEKAYPKLLAEISLAPPVLYVQGSVECLSMPQLAFVGSRKSTPIGEDNAFAFARYLAERNITITSGLAIGIDASAHYGALQGKGITVGVMATGIDKVYPQRNRSLATEIVKSGGAIITEFKLGTPARAGHFPRRNRIISGLSLGVLVIEAAMKSGSLITARYALEQNREVFAIPGSIHSPLSRGCHALIKQGATLVECAADIAQQLQGWCGGMDGSGFVFNNEETRPKPSLSEHDQILLDSVGYEATSLEMLCHKVEWPVANILSGLMTLQLQGLVLQVGSDYQRL
jgi:DNA processing protein